VTSAPGVGRRFPATSIEVRETVEPLSTSSLAPDTTYISPIASDAFRLLVRELHRYCAGALTGRSFLVSGHRGAGKTTLVTSAVLELLRVQRDPGIGRPLLVTLHGPGLFPPEQAISPSPPHRPRLLPRALRQRPVGGTSQASQAARPSSAGEERGTPAVRAPEPSPTQAMPARSERREPGAMDAAGGLLLQMILELHRASAREMARAFRAAGKARGGHAAAEGLELAAQLELELFEPLTADPARLRQFWLRGGFLPQGVLAAPAFTRLPIGPPEVTSTDQGWRELLALSGLWQAYRRISGEFSEKQQTKADAVRKVEAAIAGAGSDGKDLTNALLTLLTGGLVGAGLHAANTSASAATLLGILSALGAAFTMKLSSSRALARTESWESTFIPNLRPETLDRVLPVLLERLRDAGLYPVFLVDELDKVPNLSARILPLVHHLKKLVAERAFFCFLTDRDYFEEMRTRADQASYSVEYTYFTDRLFVAFAPEDLHAYLKERLRRPDKPGDDAAASDENRRALEAYTDFPFVEYVVLHRAQMHALDIQREIAALEKTGGILQRPGLVRSDPAYLLDVVIQLGIELVLDDSELRATLARDPTYRRLAHDALYYLPRKWDPDAEFDLDSTEVKTAFGGYLLDRTGSKQALTFAKDAEFLLGKVRLLASLLSDSARFTASVAVWNTQRKTRSGSPREADGLATEILDVVARLQDANMPLEALGSANPRSYRWRYDRTGLARPPVGVPEPAVAPSPKAAPSPPSVAPPPPEWRADCDFITAVERALVPGLDFTVLAAQFRLLPLTPAWLQVSEAIKRLREAEERGTAPLPADPLVVHQFATVLRGNGVLLGDALAAATVLGQMSRKPSAGENLIAGLSAMARAYALETLDEPAVAAVMAGARESLSDYFKVQPGWTVALLEDEASVAAWATALNAFREEAARIVVNEELLKALARLAWTTWEKRFDARFRGNPVPPPSPVELLNAASGRLPARLLKHAVERITIAEWTEVCIRGLWPDLWSPSEDVPLWMSRVALHALGFRGVDSIAVIGPTRSLSSDTTHLRDAWDWLGSGLASPAAVLLVRWEERSAIEDWLPGTGVAGLSVNLRELDPPIRSIRGAMGGLLRRLGVTTIAFEVPDAASDEGRLNDRLNQWIDTSQKESPPFSPIFIYVNPPPQRQLRTPFVLQPKGLDDLREPLLRASPRPE
jgi:hypothetical protein